jgi:HEAT repeat protein
MLNYDNFAITLGRAINVFNTSPDDVPQQKGALRALVALSSLGAVALRAEDGEVRIGGREVPVTLPFVSGLLACLERHRVRRLNISHGASATDLLKLVRALAADDRTALEDQYETIGVEVIALVSERLSVVRRPASVTDAFDRAEIEEAEAAAAALERSELEGGSAEPEAKADSEVATGPEDIPQINEDDTERTVEIETISPAAEEDQETTLEIETVSPEISEDPESTVEIEIEAPASPPRTTASDLSMAMLRLAGAGDDDDIEELVFVLTGEVEKELDLGNDSKALEGIASLVNLESQVPQTEKGIYTQALLRLLLPETLVRVARLVTQSKHARYAVAVLHRAGSVGTDSLFEQMVKAPSVEEMDAYGAALPAVTDGVKNLVDSLGSQDSTIVSIAIDQLSKLRVTEVATTLGTLAMDHPKKVIRQGACRGLLQMQGDDQVLEPIRMILDSKSAVLFGRCVQRGASDQVVGLLSAVAITTEDIVARKELCRSLGRAGSTRAIQQLVKISLPGGRFFGRKPLDSRLAAIEGLGLVEGPLAHGTLQDLTADRNPAIRAAAGKMLEKTEERPPI